MTSARKNRSDHPEAEYLHLLPCDIEPGDEIEISGQMAGPMKYHYHGYARVISVSRPGFMRGRAWRAQVHGEGLVMLGHQQRYWVKPHDGPGDDWVIDYTDNGQ